MMRATICLLALVLGAQGSLLSDRLSAAPKTKTPAKKGAAGAAAGAEAGADSCKEVVVGTGDDAKCNHGCLCKALQTALMAPTPYMMGATPTAVPSNIVSTSPMALFAHDGDTNPLDAICLAMDNPGTAKATFETAMGVPAGAESRRFRFAEMLGTAKPAKKSTAKKGAAPDAGSESGASMLGKDHECLDTCFRLSWYMQSNPNGMDCVNFKVIKATKLTDPMGIPGLNAPLQVGLMGGQIMRFQKHQKQQELPEGWKALGITQENRYEVAKTSRYYKHLLSESLDPESGEDTPKALGATQDRDIISRTLRSAQQSLTPADS